MGFTIPIVRQVDGPSRQTVQATLDGVLYSLVFQWNERQNSWFMSVYDSTFATNLIGDRKCVVNTLIDPNFTGRQPGGLFLWIDTGNPPDSAVDPGYDDLGNRVKLQYFSVDELI